MFSYVDSEFDKLSIIDDKICWESSELKLDMYVSPDILFPNILELWLALNEKWDFKT